MRERHFADQTMLRLFTGLFALLLLIPSTALGDDWVAQQLRGRVLQLVAGQWQPLNRGDVVSDTRPIQTLATGHVTLTRGAETLELGPKTQIRIFDKAGKKPFTTVKEDFGSVSVEAEVRNVQHFAVDTPFLAAVVKGTRFTVTSGKSGASVRVRRGHVAVEDKQNGNQVLLSVGQSATVGAGGQMAVGGSGKLPVVTSKTGEPVDQQASTGGDSDQSDALVRLDVGGSGGDGGLANLSVGGSGDAGSGGIVNVGVGSGSGGGLVNVGVGADDGGSGKIINLNVGKLHLGL